MTGLDADLATLRGMSQNGWLPGSGANPMAEALDRVEAEITRLRQEVALVQGWLEREKEISEAAEREASEIGRRNAFLVGELARLQEGLRIIATTTYPARYLGETKDGTKLYGGSDDASRFARALLAEDGAS